MRPLTILMTLLVSLSSFIQAQDTTCGIVWYPPIQISPGIGGVDEANPSIAVQGDTVHITWAFTSQKFPYRRSVDGGQTFEPVRELAPDTMNTIAWGQLVGSYTHLTALWVEYPQRMAWMVQSLDRGLSWSDARAVTDSIGGFLFASTLCDSILLGTPRDGDYRRIYRSTNAGTTWFPTLPRIIGNDPRIAMTPGAVHRVSRWVFDSAGVWSEFVVQYRKSTDLGETWSDSVNLSSMNSTAYDPAIAAEGVGDSATVLTAWRDTKHGCLTLVGCAILGRRSIDAGESFLPEERFDDRPAGYKPDVDVQRRVLATVWTDDLEDSAGGVWAVVSTDGGLTWCPPVHVSPGMIPSVKITENTIHVAWNQFVNGRWRVLYRRGVLLPTSVEEEPQTLPPFASLSQNYPNPFNPSTTISFRLTASSSVELSIYDVLGREVATLVNETKQAGEHRLQWDASAVPSGVYYYRLRVRDGGDIFTQTKKMVIIH